LHRDTPPGFVIFGNVEFALNKLSNGLGGLLSVTAQVKAQICQTIQVFNQDTEFLGQNPMLFFMIFIVKKHFSAVGSFYSRDSDRQITHLGASGAQWSTLRLLIVAQNKKVWIESSTPFCCFVIS
jgi:hypothetical protein